MTDQILAALIVMASTTALSAALVPVSRMLARRFSVMDAPGTRKVHGSPMPRLGGVAVAGSFLTVILAGYFLAPALHLVPGADALREAVGLLAESYRVETKLIAILVGSAIAFGVGLADDVLGERFPVAVKALGQIAAAGILVFADVQTSFLPFPWMNAVISILWVVGITNAFNLLDNMDGLSAGVAFVAAGVLLINAWSLGEFFITLILVAFMGSLAGFLFFNFHPASVFLGDCGSHFIGYVMASLTLVERYVSHASSNLFPVLMPVLVLALPVIDTATVIVIRIREGRPIYVGDRCHLSHRLVHLGFSQRNAVLFIYLATLCLGLGAVTLADASLAESMLILIRSAFFVALILILMFTERRSVPRGGE